MDEIVEEVKDDQLTLDLPLAAADEGEIVDEAHELHDGDGEPVGDLP